MVTMQNIKSLLDLIHNELAQAPEKHAYEPTSPEERAHLQLSNLFYDRADKYSLDPAFWHTLFVGGQLPIDFAQQGANVDEIYQLTRQYYHHLQAHRIAYIKDKEIEQLAKMAPPDWKMSILRLFHKLIVREVAKRGVLSQHSLDAIIDQIELKTQLNTKLIAEEVNFIVKINQLFNEESLDNYIKTIAHQKVTRAVMLMASASGTLATKSAIHLNTAKATHVRRLEQKQQSTARWQNEAYRHHFFSPSTYPTFVKAYNNPNAIQSALEYLHLRLAKDNQIYVQPALNSFDSRNDIAQIHALFDTKVNNANAQLCMKALKSLWEGLLQESNLQFSNPIDQIIANACLEKIRYYLSFIKTQYQVENHYTATMDLLSLLITNVLRLQKGFQKLDTYYTALFPLRCPEIAMSNVISANKGRKAMMACLSGLLYPEKPDAYLPGFPLPSVYHDSEYGYFEIVGFKDALQHRALKADDTVRYLGRNSETCFHLKADVITQLKKDMIHWCQGKTRTLVLDLTIEKRQDELVSLINSDEIQHLIQANKLQVIIFKSEQKQQSLGSGKFSAGSACLIATPAQVTQFNQRCQSVVCDYNLAAFYRYYASDITLDVIDYQSALASKLADYMKSKIPDATIIANGPFILIGIDSINMVGPLSSDVLQHANFKLQRLCRNTWPVSGSFGFAQTTYSQWDMTMIRISVGLEQFEVLTQQFDKEFALMRSEFESSKKSSFKY